MKRWKFRVKIRQLECIDAVFAPCGFFLEMFSSFQSNNLLKFKLTHWSHSNMTCNYIKKQGIFLPFCWQFSSYCSPSFVMKKALTDEWRDYFEISLIKKSFKIKYNVTNFQVNETNRCYIYTPRNTHTSQIQWTRTFLNNELVKLWYYSENGSEIKKVKTARVLFEVI